MSEHELHNDNDGRRSRLRNAFSNDPIYRRVKDAMLILMACAAAWSQIKDLSFFSPKNEPIPQGPQESKVRIWERLNQNDQNIAILQASIKNIETNQADMKQDVRELLRQVGELRRR